MDLNHALGELVAKLTPDIWGIIFIIVLLAVKEYRFGGMILVALMTINGHLEWWHYAIVGVLVIFTNYLAPAAYYSEKYEKKLKKLGIDPNNPQNSKSRNDPDTDVR